jgi:hypothetical protein
MVKAYVLEDSTSWQILLALIPFWFFAYLYLDSVIPNTYGIAKNLCFCLSKQKKVPANVKRIQKDLD